MKAAALQRAEPDLPSGQLIARGLVERAVDPP
jgi:hypothetical protein